MIDPLACPPPFYLIVRRSPLAARRLTYVPPTPRITMQRPVPFIGAVHRAISARVTSRVIPSAGFHHSSRALAVANPAEVSSIIEDRIINFQQKVDLDEVG